MNQVQAFPRSSPPGPRGIPVIGSGVPFAKDPLTFFSGLLKYGEIARFKVMNLTFITVHSPELIQRVMIADAKKYEKSVFLKRTWRPFFGDGLVSSDGETWKRQRRLTNTAFTREQIAMHMKAVEACTDDVIRSWSKDGTRAIDLEMMDLTLQIVLKTLFGSSLDAATLDEIKDCFKICSDYFNFSISPWGVLSERLPTPQRSRFLRSVNQLVRIVKGLIETRRRHPEASGDLLSTLLNARDENGDALSDEELCHELLTLIGAGHETTSFALTYTFYLLAKHPEIQREARAEADRILKGQPLDMNALKELTLVGQIFHESLRLYPPIAAIARNAVEETELAGFKIERGSQIVVPVWALHRNEAVYGDATNFRPSRWAEGFAQALPKTAFMPFGYGPRICVGSGFATMESLTILTKLLQRFEFDDAPAKLDLQMAITVAPRRHVRLKVRSRRD